MSCSTHSGYRNSGEYISDTESTVCSEGSPRRSTFSLHKFVQSLSRRKLSNPENNAKLPQYHGRRRGGVMVDETCLQSNKQSKNITVIRL